MGKMDSFSFHTEVMRNSILPIIMMALFFFALLHNVGVIKFPGELNLNDIPNITIQHPDNTRTILRCKTGSGVNTCKHQDLILLISTSKS